jgi:hypothetical protein
MMPRAAKTNPAPELTLEERRERRKLRREKQREDNVHRGAKMHAARLKIETTSLRRRPNRRHRSMSGAPAGATGIGGIHSMPGCHNQIGSSTI